MSRVNGPEIICFPCSQALLALPDLVVARSSISPSRECRNVRHATYSLYPDTLTVAARGSTRPLRLLDVTAGSTYELAADMNAGLARAHTPGQPPLVSVAISY
jgi:hypothetical protein